jgi:hypothetical protein
MAAKLEKTKTPGIFKRGSRYVFSYRVDGKQRWESSRTLDEARHSRSETTRCRFSAGSGTSASPSR